MDPVFEWGITFMQALQELVGSLGVDLAQAFTFIGNQEFYLLLFPFLFWCIDRVIGARLVLLYLVSVLLNANVKEWIAQPRPYELHPDIAVVDPAGEFVYGEGYGMPSGHAQWSITIWGALALWMRKGWFWVTAVFLVFFIGMSRLILGVHFPAQVLAGWGAGVLVIAVYLLLTNPVEKWLAELEMQWQLLVAVFLPLGLLLIQPVPDTIAAMAVLLGFGVGLALCNQYIPFTVDGNWVQRLLRYLVGVVILLAIYFGLSAVFPGEGESWYIPLRFLRYALLGFWITFGAPWMFTRVNLAADRMRTV